MWVLNSHDGIQRRSWEDKSGVALPVQPKTRLGGFLYSSDRAEVHRLREGADAQALAQK